MSSWGRVWVLNRISERRSSLSGKRCPGDLECLNVVPGTARLVADAAKTRVEVNGTATGNKRSSGRVPRR